MPKSPKTGKSPARRTAAPRTTATRTTAPAATLTHEAIATRAFELFLKRGAGHGSDFDDWLAAERELLHSANL
jgi:DUF2934 family protein